MNKEQAYIDGDQVDLGVTVLASLGGGHVDNLARPSLDDDVAAVRADEHVASKMLREDSCSLLPQSRALHGVGERGARRGLRVLR